MMLICKTTPITAAAVSEQRSELKICLSSWKKTYKIAECRKSLRKKAKCIKIGRIFPPAVTTIHLYLDGKNKNKPLNCRECAAVKMSIINGS